MRTVVDFSLYSLVLAMQKVEHGDMKAEEFIHSFKRVFGNEQDPHSLVAERGIGRNYLTEIEEDIKKFSGRHLHGTSKRFR